MGNFNLKSYALGIATAMIIAGVAGMVAGVEIERFRCLAVDNEKNLTRFGSRLQVDWNMNSSTWYKTLIYGPQQIGAKVEGCPCLVFNYTSRWYEDPVNSVQWEGLVEVECPKDVASLREYIYDNTNYTYANESVKPIKTVY